MTPRILIVEDVVRSREELATILIEEGYDVSEAADASEGLSRLHEEEIDLVVLDVVLPGTMDGFALCRWIKKQEPNADLPVIFITALDDTASKVKGLDLGAADYVTKPFKREEVVARVRTHIRIRELTQSLSRMNRDLRENQEQLEQDLLSASLVQRAFLPARELEIPGVELRWRFTPSRHLGGDIFNVLEMGGGWWGAWLVDVSGHGVPPSLVTIAVAQAILQELHDAFVHAEGAVPSPSEVIHALEKQFPMERFGRFFTIILIMMEPSTGRMIYSNGGHPPPLLVTRSAVELLEEGGPPVGMGLARGSDERVVELEPGDRLFLYTDGLIEQMDEEKTPFGIERLQEVTGTSRDLSLDEACDALFAALDQYRGAVEIEDDLALLALEKVG